jgi:hypothetical protein
MAASADAFDFERSEEDMQELETDEYRPTYRDLTVKDL